MSIRRFKTNRLINATKIAINIEQVRLDKVWKVLRDDLSWLPLWLIPDWFFTTQVKRMSSLVALRNSLEATDAMKNEETFVMEDEYVLIKDWIEWIDLDA